MFCWLISVSAKKAETAGLESTEVDFTCSVFVHEGKTQAKKKAAWLVTTCPGIIPFGSTAGHSFLWFSPEYGVQQQKNQIFLFIVSRDFLCMHVLKIGIFM